MTRGVISSAPCLTFCITDGGGIEITRRSIATKLRRCQRYSPYFAKSIAKIWRIFSRAAGVSNCR